MKLPILLAAALLGAPLAGCSNSAKSKPQASAPTQPVLEARAPILAVLTRAEWCSVCKAHGARVGALLTKKATNGEVEIVVNDITDEARSAASRSELERRRLGDAVPATAGAGLIAFVDANRGKVVAQVTVAHSDAEIAQVLGMARAQVEPSK